MLRNATDRIAQEAARLFDEGQFQSLDAAIRKAADILKLGHVRLPTHGHVRKHVQGRSMQSMGAEAYRNSIVEVWQHAEELMTILEDHDPYLMGRAAKGLVDAGVSLHIRLFTSSRMSDIAQRLEDFGFEEGQFGTADTRYGRFDKLSLQDQGSEITIIRCAPHQRDLVGFDLFTKKPLESVSLVELRQRIAAAEQSE